MGSNSSKHSDIKQEIEDTSKFTLKTNSSTTHFEKTKKSETKHATDLSYIDRNEITKNTHAKNPKTAHSSKLDVLPNKVQGSCEDASNKRVPSDPTSSAISNQHRVYQGPSYKRKEVAPYINRYNRKCPSCTTSTTAFSFSSLLNQDKDTDTDEVERICSTTSGFSSGGSSASLLSCCNNNEEDKFHNSTRDYDITANQKDTNKIFPSKSNPSYEKCEKDFSAENDESSSIGSCASYCSVCCADGRSELFCEGRQGERRHYNPSWDVQLKYNPNYKLLMKQEHSRLQKK